MLVFTLSPVTSLTCGSPSELSCSGAFFGRVLEFVVKARLLGRSCFQGRNSEIEEDAARSFVFHPVFRNVFVSFDSDLQPGFLFYFVRAIKKINL